MEDLSDMLNQHEVFHKKKEAKKKQKAIRLIANSNKTISKNSTLKTEKQINNLTDSIKQLDNKLKDKTRTRNQIANIEIDEYLQQLLFEGLIEENFIPYYAKACHVLGISKINTLVINVREYPTPARLLAYKVKGAMSLHYKREYIKISQLKDKG